MMKKPIRIAVVGIGQFGTLHAQTLARMPEAQLTALVDSDLEAVKGLGEALGVASLFTSLDALIESRIADAVVIATRTETHLELAQKAAQAGLSVLVEKPFALSAADIRTFQKQCIDSVVMVDHLCLFHSLVVPLIDRVRQTGFRALNFVRHRPCTISQRFPEAHPISLIMVHDLYVAAQLVDGKNPVEITAVESRHPSGRVDMAWAMLRWDDGRVATFQSHLTLPEGCPADGWDRIEVYGDTFYSKTITNPAPWTWTDTRTQWPVNLEIHASGGMLVAVLQDFLRACVDGRITRGCRVEDALQIQEWTERLILSSKT